MEERKLVLLLHIIKSNGNIKRLLKNGGSYKDIFELTQIAIERGFLTYENDKVELTTTGTDFLIIKQAGLKKQNKDEWIEKDLKNKISKLDKKTLFLPNQNELSF